MLHEITDSLTAHQIVAAAMTALTTEDLAPAKATVEIAAVEFLGWTSQVEDRTYRAQSLVALRAITNGTFATYCAWAEEWYPGAS